MVLLCLPLGSTHFYICSVVAPPHWATMFDNPIQAVEDTLTGCQILAKKKKKKKKISKKGNGKIQRKRYQPRAFITNWTTAARNNRNLCYSNRKVVVNVREREFNKLLGFTNKKVIHCQVHWICLVPCRMLNRMEPDPRWGESQHDGSLFVSSSLP